MENTSYTLGLDIGTNSIGWAVIDHDTQSRASGVRAAGVRIFQEAVDAKTRTPKNHARRAARALRRILARRRRRKAKLRGLLIRARLLPSTLGETQRPEEIFNALGNPYELRKRALDERLERHALGRVLTHLCARRGFQSNRKSLLGVLAEEFDDLIEAAAHIEPSGSETGRAQREANEEGKVKAAIGELHDAIAGSGARTLGEYLAGLPRDERKRGRYTDRAMFKEEFEAIWSSQARFHPELQSTELKAQMYEAIFFQRPLKSAKARIGKCSFERGRKRAAVARLESQQFRILQDVNHLAVRDPRTGTYRDLDTPEREKLIAMLMDQKTLAWGAARKTLGLHKNETFNLEDAGRGKLKGNTTATSLNDILGSTWAEFDAAQRRQLVEDLLTITDKQHLVKRLRDHWQFPRELQYRLATLELEPGYMSHSVRAITRMLPTLQVGGKYHEARAAAGYFEQRRVTGLESLPEPPVVRNPVVQKALFETRKVINALIRLHGKPRVIRVEMARDLKMSGRQKEQFEKQQRANEKANERARAQLAEMGVQQAGRDDLLKFRLWEECRGECPYTGRAIGRHQLFSADIDIEHIIPYARCLDDSYMNKTLCFADENRSVKRGQTPWEAYGADEARWQQLLQRIKSMPYAKRNRFHMREVEAVDDFISRQLNDTRYIAVEVKRYLDQLGSDVQVTKGGVTADLRRIWGLNKLLGFDPDKKLRIDHRHHALDAIVIGLSDRTRYRKLAAASSAAKDSSLQHGRLLIPEPWTGFEASVRAVLDPIIVSHAANRRLVGALHEATAYGYRAGTGKYHYRKRLDGTFSSKAVDEIVDEAIRRLVRERLSAFGGDPKKAFATPLMHLDRKTPIRSVRLAKNASESSLLGIQGVGGGINKFYELGSNHHIEIFRQNATGAKVGRVVSTLEAARRVRRLQQPIVNKEHELGWSFESSLIINDMVEVESDAGRVYYRVQKISNDNKITLRHHRAATLDRNHDRLIVRPNTLRGRKVAVDPIGRVSYASD